MNKNCSKHTPLASQIDEATIRHKLMVEDKKAKKKAEKEAKLDELISKIAAEIAKHLRADSEIEALQDISMETIANLLEELLPKPGNDEEAEK